MLRKFVINYSPDKIISYRYLRQVSDLSLLQTASSHHIHAMVNMSADENCINWYHGRISREAATDLLINGDQKTNGIFLVRDSSTAPGDYVLSVLYDGEVIHHLIRRHGEDAFFSIDDTAIAHGLETLIERMCRPDGLGLTQPLLKDPPPHDSRRHGRTNLLHRATKEGNYTVASELLKCGYRSLEAKNEEGQNAAHLACRLGNDDILDKLINSGVATNCLEKLINCRDSDGYTPLHYACQSNRPSTVRLLVESGKANVQLRNTKTGWVALHEAAWRGHTEVARALLSLGAPLLPRTADGHTPLRLAEDNGHDTLALLLANHKVAKPTTCKSEWFHGTLDRNEAVAALKSAGDADGAFLVRYSNKHGGHVLTVSYERQIYNYPIQRKDEYYYIDDGPLLGSLEALVEHYTRWGPDGLPTALRHPRPPRIAPPPLPTDPRPRLSIASQMPRFASTTLPSKQRRSKSLHDTSTLPLPGKKESKLSTLQPIGRIKYVPPPEEFIPSENLILGSIIGEGEFGSVYKGVYQTREGFEEPVALKTLRADYLPKDREEFVREARLMMRLDHHCIVRIIGLSDGPDPESPLLMVQELVPLGSMLEYLLKNPKTVCEYDLKVWASQIACGMEYLEGRKLVHRDLAARNILLASRHQAKISDFGLSRTVHQERDYYRATQGGRWPIKWYAPEAYNYGTFSSASDVWSFGVTLWEMFSYGQQPYGDMKGADVIRLVEGGSRLERPPDCPVTVYETMERCWSYLPRDRPTFGQLVTEFNDENSYANVRELITQTDIS